MHAVAGELKGRFAEPQKLQQVAPEKKKQCQHQKAEKHLAQNNETDAGRRDPFEAGDEEGDVSNWVEHQKKKYGRR